MRSHSPLLHSLLLGMTFAVGLMPIEVSATTLSGKKIFVVRRGGPQFTEVFNIIKKELSTKNEVSDLIVEKDTPYEVFKDEVQDKSPHLVIYMDNQSIGFGIRYNQEQSQQNKKIRGIGLMGLNLKSYLKGNKDISGIAFESPAYTLLTNFRYLVSNPIKNVLVFYRKKLFQDAVEEASKQLSQEKIKLHAVNVEQLGTGRAEIDAFIKKNLKKEVNSGKYDAVWVMLDSFILNQDLFGSVWLPVARSAKIPFVSGVEQLVSKEFDFCAFGVTPNLPDLAMQAVQMVEAILGTGVSPSELGVEELIAVNKILNMDRLKKLNFQLKQKDLSEVKILR